MYDPRRHHRRSIRLQGYDYSQAGAYFVTICCQDRIHRFGKIVNGVMELNDAGKMVEKWYWELNHKFPNIQCGEMVVMPNHIHLITVIVGADLRVCPDSMAMGEHIGSPLYTIVQWYKTMTTNEYIRGVKSNHWQPFNKRIWQRNYWEHIIRNENEYNRIAQYIGNNPAQWERDKLNGGIGNIVMEPLAEYGVE